MTKIKQLPSYYDEVPRKCCHIEAFIANEHFYDFLAGLNPEFNQVRI